MQAATIAAAPSAKIVPRQLTELLTVRIRSIGSSSGATTLGRIVCFAQL
jgi:hypothetical protein